MRQKPPAAASCPFLCSWFVLALVIAVPWPADAQAPRNLTATVSSFTGRVTLQWQAPTTPGFTGYLIEAGLSPGTTAVSIPVSRVLIYGVNAPNGRYFVRVRALYGSTPGPAASNEVEVVVALQPPSAPANFTATVARLTVTFTWSSGSNSSTTTGWELHAGSAPGLSDLARVPLPFTTRTLTVTAPEGRYYVRLYAINHVGPSLPSTELLVMTGPGVCDVPLTPTGFSALAGQGAVHLSWDAWSGPLPTGYLIAAGSSPGASDVGTFPIPRSTVLLTFAPAGAYYARLAAYNACGATAFGDEISFTILPPSNVSLVGTWNGTVTGYTKPYPWAPITSFRLTLGSDPLVVGQPLNGTWSDNQGCRNSRVFGAGNVLPAISIESLECNDGDFLLTITYRSAAVAEGVCNSGPDCRFRMTR